MEKYIRMLRLDHWIKQVFIVPGVVASYFLTNAQFNADFIRKFALGFVATCMIASANYVINEWLDAKFDRYHPTKKYRSVVSGNVNGKIVCIIWISLSLLAFLISIAINRMFLLTCAWLWVMGILYNVKPFRLKDIPYVDVLSESINNAIRLLLGWFIATELSIPPSSLLLGYWFAGAFLMAIKRFAEFRMIGNKTTAGKYRRSFQFYSERSLLISSVFYAMCSLFFIGIFLIKYRVELILIVPPLIALYCYYIALSFSPDSAVQRPEKLFKEKGLMAFCIILVLMFSALMKIDIPALSIFTNSDIIVFS